MIEKGLPEFNANEIVLEARCCNFVLKGDKYFHIEEDYHNKDQNGFFFVRVNKETLTL